METNITISMEEYKELLMIKGKYEELKSMQTINPIVWKEPTLTRTLYGSGEDIPKSPYKITCDSKEDILQKNGGKIKWISERQ